MGATTIAIEMARDAEVDMARQVEHLASSALMIDSEFRARIASYVEGIGAGSAVAEH